MFTSCYRVASARPLHGQWRGPTPGDRDRSSVDDKIIAAIASTKANATRNLTFAPIWFAAWIGVDPHAAIPALAARFASMNDSAEQTKLAPGSLSRSSGGRSQDLTPPTVTLFTSRSASQQQRSRRQPGCQPAIPLEYRCAGT